MRHEKSPLHPGMTAIAAVLALSSTPLLAQTADVVPIDPAAPAMASPPPVISDPVPTASAPGAAALNIPKITVNLDDAPQSAAAVEPKAKPAVTAKATTSRAAKSAEAAAPVAAAASMPMVQDVMPMTPSIVNEPVVESAPAILPQPLAKAQPSAGEDDTLPIAGAVGLGVLALAGGTLALTRRKRRDEDVVPDAEPLPVERHDLLLTEPVPVLATASPMAARVDADAPTTTLPAEFDLSRFGRHVQAAYRGPTPDNPSLSLKNRLRRANFYDQRERMAAEPVVTQPETRAEVATARPAPARSRSTDQVVTRPSNWTQPGFRPAYTS